jgi:hypothetical protein
MMVAREAATANLPGTTIEMALLRRLSGAASGLPPGLSGYFLQEAIRCQPNGRTQARGRVLKALTKSPL